MLVHSVTGHWEQLTIPPRERSQKIATWHHMEEGLLHLFEESSKGPS